MTDENTTRAGRAQWRGQASSASAASPGRSWTIRLLGLAGCGLALAGVLVGILLKIRPTELPYLITVPITEYEDPRLPVNAFAQEDARALIQYFPGRNEPHADVQQHDQLERYLSRLGDRPHETLIVYLSALAVRRGTQVYILAGNTDAMHPERGILLTDVLKRIADAPAKHRLLLLDLMQPVVGPSIGILSNDVAAGVRQAVTGRDDKDFWVLSACSPGEVSLPAECFRQSAFGYYLCEGLAGHADGCGAHGKVDGRIALSELADFVRMRVQRWARDNRKTLQTPMLLPSINDAGFVVTPAPQTVPDTASASNETAETYPPELLRGWQMRDAWQDEKRFRLAPEVFAELETNLRRAEQCWRLGAPTKDLNDNLRRREQAWNNAVTEAGLDATPRPFTLPLTADAAGGVDQAVAAAFAEMRPVPAKPADPMAAKALEELLKKDIESFTKGHKSPETVAWAVFDQLAEDRVPTFDRVQLGLRVIEEMKPSRLYAEIILLKRLVNHGDKDWAPALVHDLIAGLREEGRILAGDPRAVAGALDDLKKAAALRRRIEKAFITPDDDAEPTNNDTPAAGVVDAYRPIRARVDQLTQAYRARERARGLLPGLVPYILDKRSADKGLGERLRGAVQAYQIVDSALTAIENSGTGQFKIDQPDQFQGPIDDLATYTRENGTLCQRFRKAEVESLGKSDAPHPLARYLELQARLASPLVHADVRAGAWKMLRELEVELCKKTQVQDDEDNGRHASGTVAATAEDLDRPWDRAATAVRAWAGVNQLELKGAPDVAQLTGELTRLERQAPAQAWSDFARQLGQAFQKDVQDHTKRAQDLRLRYRAARQSLWRWLNQHYLAESDNLPGDSNYRESYRDAAGEYQRTP